MSEFLTQIVKCLDQNKAEGLSNLEYDGEKFKWRNNLTELKKFVQDSLGVKGKWSSPGGGNKKFKEEDGQLILNWYFKKQSTLLFQGAEADGLKNILIDLLAKDEQSHIEEKNAVANSGSQDEGDNTVIMDSEEKSYGLSPLPNNNQNVPNDAFPCRCNTMATEIEGIKLDIVILQSQMASENAAARCAYEEMSKLHLELKNEQHKNAMLETRAAKAEEERDSLRLALSFLMQDRVGQSSNPSSVPGANDKPIASNKQNNLQKVAPSSNNISNVNGYATSTLKKKGNQLCPSLSLHNSFAALHDEVGGENGGRQSSDINLDFGYQVAPDCQLIQDSSTPTACSDGAVSIDPVTGHRKQNKQSLLKTPQKAKSSIVIIGDSIVKHINPTKLSKRKVHKFTYPGKTASEINNEVNTIDLNQAPSHVIVHAGTNNIPLQSVGECVNDIEKLVIGVKEKFPNAEIGISSITLRQDIASTAKIKEVNAKIKIITQNHDVKFIDNSSLDKSSLNCSKLHLNSKGSAILATHFINFIHGGKSTSKPQKGSKRDFHKGNMIQLEELLKLISHLNRKTTK